MKGKGLVTCFLPLSLSLFLSLSLPRPSLSPQTIPQRHKLAPEPDLAPGVPDSHPRSTPPSCCSGFRVWNLRFRVPSLGFEACGSGLRGLGMGLGFYGLDFVNCTLGLAFGVWHLNFVLWVSVLGFEFWGVG